MENPASIFKTFSYKMESSSSSEARSFSLNSATSSRKIERKSAGSRPDGQGPDLSGPGSKEEPAYSSNYPLTKTHPFLR